MWFRLTDCAGLAIPYLHAIFGEAADYFITLRHPGMAGVTSFAEMEHITEDIFSPVQSPAGWKSIVMPQMKGQIECWDGLTYREQFLYFWQVYYKQIIRPGVSKARIHPVVYE